MKTARRKKTSPPAVVAPPKSDYHGEADDAFAASLMRAAEEIRGIGPDHAGLALIVELAAREVVPMARIAHEARKLVGHSAEGPNPGLWAALEVLYAVRRGRPA
jgi:hypothetical protein